MSNITVLYRIQTNCVWRLLPVSGHAGRVDCSVADALRCVFNYKIRVITNMICTMYVRTTR